MSSTPPEASLPPELEREFRDSRLFLGVAALLFLVMAVLGPNAGARIFFLAVALYWGQRVVRPQAPVRVTEQGIEYGYFFGPSRLLPWHDISDVKKGHGGTIDIELKDPQAFRRQLGFFNRVMDGLNRFTIGCGPTAIGWGALNAPRAEVLETLEKALDAYTLRATRDGDALPSGGGQLEPA